MNPTELLKLADFDVETNPDQHQFGQCHLPMYTGNLEIIRNETLTFEEEEKLKSIVQNFVPVQGWFCLQSSVAFFTKPEDFPELETILYGEICHQDGRSIHIRPRGNQGWTVTEYQETSSDQPDYVIEQSRLLMQLKQSDFEQLDADENSVFYLAYHVYWQSDTSQDNQGVIPMHSRFTGFVKGEK